MFTSSTEARLAPWKGMELLTGFTAHGNTWKIENFQNCVRIAKGFPDVVFADQKASKETLSRKT